MSIELIRLLIDFGLVILIWIVQLVVYPGFIYYAKSDLVRWHNLYTSRITMVVFPLMFAQLIIGGLQLWNGVSWYTAFGFLIILSLWLSTMLQFVPLHNRISNNDFDENTLTSLVNRNWLRTFLWVGLFAMSLVHYLK